MQQTISKSSKHYLRTRLFELDAFHLNKVSTILDVLSQKKTSIYKKISVININIRNIKHQSKDYYDHKMIHQWVLELCQS